MSKSEQYERLVKHLLETRVSQSVEHFEIFGSKHYPGKSGHNHQIDVSAQFRIAGVTILVLVECKHYSGRVGIDDILEFAGRLDDIAAHKGIVVSTVGFQDGAETLARSKGIALVVACDVGWVPHIEAPVAATQRHEEFVEKVRTYLDWALPQRVDAKAATRAAQRIAAFDITSQLGLISRPFLSLSATGWGIRYAAESGCHHAFEIVGGQTDLVLDRMGLFELIAIEASCNWND